MTRITRPTTAQYSTSQTATFINQPRRPSGPQAVKQVQAILDASKDTHEASQSGPLLARPLLHPYHTLAFLAHRRQAQHLKSQGGQAAIDRPAEEGHLAKKHVMATLAKYANNPQALAGFFDALGPHNTLKTLQLMDHHERNVISSGYGSLLDPAKRYGWLGNDQLQYIHHLETWHRGRLHGQRETLIDALSNAVTGGLSDVFIEDLAHTASATPQTANQLSQLLVKSNDAALMPLKEALYNTLMTPEKALSESSDADTRSWVRAATLLLENNPSEQWLQRLQDSVGSAGLSQFVTAAVQDTVNVTGKVDGFSYGDEDYQRGLEGLLKGLNELQGDEHTEFKAHVFSAAGDAMGEAHTREELTEGLKALFVSDPKGIAIETANNPNVTIESISAFAFLIKETMFNYSKPDDGFVDAVSFALKIYIRAQ